MSCVQNAVNKMEITALRVGRIHVSLSAPYSGIGLLNYEIFWHSQTGSDEA